MIFTDERQAASLAIFKARKAEKAINPPDYSSYKDEHSYEDGWAFYDKQAVSPTGFQTSSTTFELPSRQPSQTASQQEQPVTA